MTKNRRKKQDARNLVAESGVSYIQACREVDLNPALKGIPTSLYSLTNYTSGWQPGQLISVGSEPGVSSFTFAVNNAAAALKAGKSTLFISMDKRETELRESLVAHIGSIPVTEIREPTTDNDKQTAIRKVQAELQGAKLTVVAGESQTVASIRDRAIEASQSQAGLDFIVINCLQLVSIDGTFSNRQQALAQISRELKLLAVELNVSILVTSLLEYGSVQSSFAEGSGSLAQDSDVVGSLAQDSDVVILISQDKPQGGGLQFLNVTVVSNRGGSSGKVINCYVQPARVTIKEVPSSFEDVTVWELGEDGGVWFVQGTTDKELTAVALKSWLLDVTPDCIQDYDNLFEGEGFDFNPRTDWFFAPIFKDDPAGEAELCFVERHGEERRITELMMGTLIQE